MKIVNKSNINIINITLDIIFINIIIIIILNYY